MAARIEMTPERKEVLRLRANASAAAYVKRHPERAALAAHTRNVKRFGITPAIYSDMLKAQNNVCAICGQLETAVGYERLAVDHCHTTNKVRGLLCSSCNMALGKFKDNVNNLRAAAAYLENY